MNDTEEWWVNRVKEEWWGQSDRTEFYRFNEVGVDLSFITIFFLLCFSSNDCRSADVYLERKDTEIGRKKLFCLEVSV